MRQPQGGLRQRSPIFLRRGICGWALKNNSLRLGSLGVARVSTGGRSSSHNLSPSGVTPSFSSSAYDYRLPTRIKFISTPVALPVANWLTSFPVAGPKLIPIMPWPVATMRLEKPGARPI